MWPSKKVKQQDQLPGVCMCVKLKGQNSKKKLYKMKTTYMFAMKIKSPFGTQANHLLQA